MHLRDWIKILIIKHFALRFSFAIYFKGLQRGGPYVIVAVSTVNSDNKVPVVDCSPLYIALEKERSKKRFTFGDDRISTFDLPLYTVKRFFEKLREQIV